MGEFNAIEKIAQRRSALQWLHEKVNVPRRLSETFAPIYGEQMEKLREVDDVVRDLAKDLKPELKGARQSLKYRHYIDVAHYIGNLNDIMKKIVLELKVLDGGEHLGDFYSQHEQADLERQYFANDGLEKSAGLLDRFFGTDRERAAKFLEKMYATSIRERKAALETLVNRAERLLEFTFDRLKEMGSARATGDVNKYMKHLGDIGEKQKVFQTEFATIYNKYILPLVETARRRREQASAFSPEKAPEEAKKHQEQSRDEEDAPYWGAPSEEAAPSGVASTQPMAAQPNLVEVPDLEVFDQPRTQPITTQPDITQPMAAAPAAVPMYTPEHEAFLEKHHGQNLSDIPPENIPSAGLRRILEAPSAEVGAAPIAIERKEAELKQLLEYSAELEKQGDIEGSLQMIAIAEGLLDS